MPFWPGGTYWGQEKATNLGILEASVASVPVVKGFWVYIKWSTLWALLERELGLWKWLWLPSCLSIIHYLFPHYKFDCKHWPSSKKRTSFWLLRKKGVKYSRSKAILENASPGELTPKPIDNSISLSFSHILCDMLFIFIKGRRVCVNLHHSSQSMQTRYVLPRGIYCHAWKRTLCNRWGMEISVFDALSHIWREAGLSPWSIHASYSCGCEIHCK